MKVNGDWLHNPASQAVCRMLTNAGFQAYFVGGCVRNTLLGAPVGDIDIATDARPEIVAELAKKAGFHAIPTGIDHGTITIVAGQLPHEVTTFRKDVETDGRRATVAFSDTIDQDARRRDFTMNALYADADGFVHDPVGGMPDLEAKYVRFIDDAVQRIREDYLRILRFFRFNAWYGDPAGGFDPEALAAIAANLDGLDKLSKERVGAEVLKLLAAKDPVSTVAVMRATGVLGALLPGADDTSLGPLVMIEEQAGPDRDPLLRLAVLGGDQVSERLRLSRAQAKTLAILRNGAGSITGPGELGYRHGRVLATQILVLRAALLQERISAKMTEEVVLGADAKFPVSAKDLMPQLTGPALGKRLQELEANWIESGFKLNKPQLLAND